MWNKVSIYCVDCSRSYLRNGRKDEAQDRHLICRGEDNIVINFQARTEVRVGCADEGFLSGYDQEHFVTLQ